MTAFAGPTFFWAATALSDGAGCDSSGESSRSRFRTFRTFGFLKETTGAVAPEVIASESSPSISSKRGTPPGCVFKVVPDFHELTSRPLPAGRLPAPRQPTGTMGAPGKGPKAAQQNSNSSRNLT